MYRNNYLMALKALSQYSVTGALVRVLDFAQRYTAAIDFADMDRARLILDRTHAFADPNAAGIRLVLPTPEIIGGASARNRTGFAGMSVRRRRLGIPGHSEMSSH